MPLLGIPSFSDSCEILVLSNRKIHSFSSTVEFANIYELLWFAFLELVNWKKLWLLQIAFSIQKVEIFVRRRKGILGSQCNKYIVKKLSFVVD